MENPVADDNSEKYIICECGEEFSDDEVFSQHLANDHLTIKLETEPEEHLPEEHLPEEHLPEEHLPEEHLPEEHLPEEHLPEEHFPEEHLPEGHLPEKSEEEEVCIKFEESEESQQSYNDWNVLQKQYFDENNHPKIQYLVIPSSLPENAEISDENVISHENVVTIENIDINQVFLNQLLANEVCYEYVQDEVTLSEVPEVDKEITLGDGMQLHENYKTEIVFNNDVESMANAEIIANMETIANAEIITDAEIIADGDIIADAQIITDANIIAHSETIEDSDICYNFVKQDQSENHCALPYCEICKKTFPSVAGFKRHRGLVHSSKRRRNLEQWEDGHRVMKPKPKNWICEICGKYLSSAAALSYHQRIHTGEKPFACNVCEKRFTVPLLLQIHTRTHTGERPYQCELCTKSFGNKAAINRHHKVHTGEKPYTCPECNKSFTQSNSLKLHIRTVHLKLPAPYLSKRRKLQLMQRQRAGVHEQEEIRRRGRRESRETNTVNMEQAESLRNIKIVKEPNFLTRGGLLKVEFKDGMAIAYGVDVK